MIKICNSFILSILFMVSSQLSFLDSLIICIAEDGCISIANVSEHHDCEDELDTHHHSCGCSSHHASGNSDEPTISKTGCTDIVLEEMTEFRVSSIYKVTIPPAPAAVESVTTSFDLKEVYQRSVWKRQSVYPPLIHSSIKSTIIRC